MGIAVNDTTVARWAGTPANNVDITSASFTPAANSLILVAVEADTASNTNITMSVSGGGLTWTQRKEEDEGTDATSDGGYSSIWTAQVGASPAAMTIGVRRTAGSGGSNQISAKAYIITGHDATTPIGATASGRSTANPLNPGYTSTVNNSRGFLSANDWSTHGTPTSTDIADGANYAGNISVVSVYKAADTPTAGTAVTLNLQSPGGANNLDWDWVAVEVLPATGGGTTDNPVSDSATESESASVASSASTSDSGTFSESSSLDTGNTPKPASDAATLTDASAVARQSTVTDGASLGETSQIAAQTTGAEGTLTEASQIDQARADSATLSDSSSVSVAGTNQDKTASDSAILADTSAPAADQARADAAGLTDSSSVFVQSTTPSVTDAASLSEAANISTGTDKTALDSGLVTEASTPTASATRADSSTLAEGQSATTAGDATAESSGLSEAAGTTSDLATGDAAAVSDTASLFVRGPFGSPTTLTLQAEVLYTVALDVAVLHTLTLEARAG